MYSLISSQRTTSYGDRRRQEKGHILKHPDRFTCWYSSSPSLVPKAGISRQHGKYFCMPPRSMREDKRADEQAWGQIKGTIGSGISLSRILAEGKADASTYTEAGYNL